MAKFKTHISAGVFIGTGCIIAALIFSLLSGFEPAVWIFLAVLVGSFLPDLDLDDGVPFQIIFGLASIGLAGAGFYYLYQNGWRDWKWLVILPALIFVLVRFAAGYIFKKFTCHRGMFHSIPAAILAGLATIWFLKLFSVAQGQGLFIGSAVSIGYLGHLILDEIFSGVNLNGHSFLPNKALGSALKLFSSSKISTIVFYVSIAILISALPEVWGLLF